jgi:diguanylate cyclase (GGDEF)-like protein
VTVVQHVGRAARDAAADDVIIRARWLGTVLIVLQLCLYVPTAGVRMPYTVWWALLPAGVVAAVNLVALAGRGSGGRPVTRSVVGLAGDALAVMVLVSGFAFDAESALWTLLVLPVAEAAVRGWVRGAIGTWIAMSGGYAAVLAGSHAVWGTPPLALDSLTYRLGFLGIVTFVLVGLTTRLDAQIASTAARQAEADQLRSVALATRRMSTLDGHTVLREVTLAAEQLGFLDVQVWTRTGRLDSETGDSGGLTGEQFDAVAAAAGERGWLVLDGDLAPEPVPDGQVWVCAAVLAGDTARVLLVGRCHAPVSEHAGEGLTLLAGQTSAALANALRYEEGRAFEERLAYQASHDHLTGLPNRVLLGEAGHRVLSTERHHDRLSAVLFLDLDRFKQVNDVLGHATGDKLLVQVAERVTALVRPVDVCARVGGDEFVVLSGGHRSVLTVLALAFRLRSAIHRPFQVDDLTLDVEVSIGVSWAPDDGEDIDSLLQHADVAMYSAKHSRAGVVLYRDVAEHDDGAHLRMLGDLRRALESESQLEVHFQPIVAFHVGAPVAFEALVRWHHPERGLVPPAVFIPVAEGTSLIHRLTDVVLDRSLAALARWSAAGLEARVSVNLSPRSLVDASLPQRVGAALAAHEVDAGLLCLEITEETLVDDPERAIATMHQLKELGVRLSIDDFGTGYSSMAYLKILPVDEVKIDRTFVMDMVTSPRDGSLVLSVVDLAHRLGLAVVGEGVEDAATLQALGATGCDLAQGYHLARPMPESDVLAWSRDRSLEHSPGASA